MPSSFHRVWLDFLQKGNPPHTNWGELWAYSPQPPHSNWVNNRVWHHIIAQTLKLFGCEWCNCGRTPTVRTLAHWRWVLPSGPWQFMV